MIYFVIIFLINIGLSCVAAILSNEFLAYHSYILYLVQAILFLSFLASKINYVKDWFVPSVFILLYYLANQILGGYFVPRGYGWNKEYTDVLLEVGNYGVIVPYLMLSNLVLFCLGYRTLFCVKSFDSAIERPVSITRNLIGGDLNWVAQLAFAMTFFLVSYFEVYSGFSFQFAIVIVHLLWVGSKRDRVRWLFYVYYLIIAFAFSYNNKREIVEILFLITFIESYFSRLLFRLSARHWIAYLSILLVFSVLVLGASVLRGSGGYKVQGVADAVLHVPDYVSSDVFVDSLIDNLEINYHYGAAINSMNMGLNGDLGYQYGMSIVKILFLPVPRDQFPDKPASLMQIYTEKYRPDWWAVGGSMPVPFSSESFLNFGYLGLILFFIVWALFDRLYLLFHKARRDLFVSYSSLFLFSTSFIFARGSGIEQWFLYYLFAAPMLFLVALLQESVKVIWASRLSVAKG